jgi:hypothetical protein
MPKCEFLLPAVNTPRVCYKIHQLMLFSEVIAICCDKKHQYNVWATSEFCKRLNLAAQEAIAGYYTVQSNTKAGEKLVLNHTTYNFNKKLVA